MKRREDRERSYLLRFLVALVLVVTAAGVAGAVRVWWEGREEEVSLMEYAPTPGTLEAPEVEAPPEPQVAPEPQPLPQPPPEPETRPGTGPEAEPGPGGEDIFFPPLPDESDSWPPLPDGS